MTNEEAKAVILSIPDFIWDMTFSKSEREAFEAMFFANEKQIPKKPVLNGHMYMCPNGCKIWLLYDDELPNDNDAHCPQCGQRVDWSEVEHDE